MQRTDGISSIVEEALPFELVCTLAGVFAGMILCGMKDEIELIPGLLVIIPAVLGMRGNISCALGSRLGSGIHMGLITKLERNPELSNNFIAAIILSFVMSIFLGTVGYYFSVILGMPHHESPLIFVSISVIAGVLSGFILATVAILFAIAMFRFGIDPDNVVTPALGTIGDVITMFGLFVSTKVVIWLFIG
jgi:mgtE-like transporter